MLRNDQLDAWDRDNFFHPSTHLANFARGEMPNRIITGGSGSHITDRDGTRYGPPPLLLLDSHGVSIRLDEWKEATASDSDAGQPSRRQPDSPRCCVRIG